jgi:hypothetical protein
VHARLFCFLLLDAASVLFSSGRGQDPIPRLPALVQSLTTETIPEHDLEHTIDLLAHPKPCAKLAFYLAG